MFIARYTGVVLKPEDRVRLLAEFEDLFFSHLKPVGFTNRSNGVLLAHHMTMNLGRCREPALLHQAPVKLLIDAWAEDERVVAVRVAGDRLPVYCENPTPHITLFVNPRRGGVPKNNNLLWNWTSLPEPLVLWGTVEEVQ